METHKNKVVRTVAMSLAVFYLFVALTYVRYLPNYHSLKFRQHAMWHKSHTGGILQAADYKATHSQALMRLFFKSLPEHKKIYQALLLQVAIAFTALLAGISAAGLSLSRGPLEAYAGSHRYAYLHLRTLRI